MNKLLHLWKLLGPGMLYAGAAVGVSHLVQSTRAGSDFGWSLWWVILFSNFIKYPFFQFGPRYAAATGKDLIHGYQKLGSWALWIFIGMTLATMFVIQSAVTLVTAGLLENIFQVNLGTPVWCLLLLLFCGGLLVWDNYRFINKMVKWIIFILSGSTLIALLLAQKAPAVVSTREFSWASTPDLLFLVALVGWMPAPIDISIWHSVWSCEHDHIQKKKTSLKDQLFDFNVGYIGTALLAVCFLGLGAEIMFGSGKVFPDSANGFTKAFVEMFTETLGGWSYPIIITAAFCTMFSTTLTLLDAFPRSLRTAFNVAFENAPTKRQYDLWLGLTILGTSVLIFFFLQNMKQMVDLATTISFVVAPVLAILNTLAIRSPEVGREFRPGRGLMAFAWMGISFLGIFTVYYLFIRFWP